MHKFVIPTLTLAALAAAVSAQGVIRATGPDNDFGTLVISRDVNNTLINYIEQIEMRHVSGGRYQTVVTATMVGSADSKLIAGTLDRSTNPPTWTPNGDLEPLMRAGTATDEFQGSMSADGLVVVWDNYAAQTYPNSGGPSNTFVCRRASTAVPFNVNDVRNILGMPSGGVDPHIAQDTGSTPGTVMLMFLDVNGTISRCDLDPATGSTTNVTLASANSGRANIGFCHSPFANRDGAGRARSFLFSEYISSPFHSDGFWTEGISNDGTPEIVALGNPGGIWYANPTALGGTFVHAQATGGYGVPHRTDVCAVANCDLTGGSGRITAFGPIGQPVQFLSVVGIGITAPPYQVPPVIGNVLIFPTIGVLDVRVHDHFTGLAEWIFPSVPVLNQTFDMQVITLDGVNAQVYAGNVATLRM